VRRAQVLEVMISLAEEGMTMIEGSQFDTTGMGYLYDYGFGWGGYW